MRTPVRTLGREERRETKAPRRLALPARGAQGGLQFVRDTYAELKKVVWPTRQQTTNLSTVVVVASLAVGIILGLIDWVFTQVIQRFLVPTV